MGAAGVATPKTVLAELVAPAAEAAVTEAGHAVTAAEGARHWMINCETKSKNQ